MDVDISAPSNFTHAGHLGGDDEDAFDQVAHATRPAPAEGPLHVAEYAQEYRP